jgi:hypothetical protein
MARIFATRLFIILLFLAVFAAFILIFFLKPASYEWETATKCGYNPPKFWCQTAVDYEMIAEIEYEESNPSFNTPNIWYFHENGEWKWKSNDLGIYDYRDMNRFPIVIQGDGYGDLDPTHKKVSTSLRGSGFLNGLMNIWLTAKQSPDDILLVHFKDGDKVEFNHQVLEKEYSFAEIASLLIPVNQK